MRHLFHYRVHFGSTRTYVALSAENASIAVQRALKVFCALYGSRPSNRIEKLERSYPKVGHRSIKAPR